MAELKKTLLSATAVLSGSILYVLLNWIPIIGPLAAGFAVGYALKANPFNSFKAGVYSASIGTLTLGVLLSTSGFFNTLETSALTVVIATWVLVVWNFFGILLTGIGSFMGSLTGQAKRMVDALSPAMAAFPFSVSFGLPKPRRVIRLRPPPTEEQEKQKEAGSEKRIRFAICPNCGSSNPTSNSKCGTCGQALSEGR
jgi:ribosomal protein L40E